MDRVIVYLYLFIFNKYEYRYNINHMFGFFFICRQIRIQNNLDVYYLIHFHPYSFDVVINRGGSGNRIGGQDADWVTKVQI